MMLTGFYFLLALLILVTVHEYGHFQVARWCGIKVLRFSFGFGKIIALKKDKKGTEYAWSLIPLGGYVKMLDETEGEVPESEKHLAFNRKSVWARIAVVAAGPLANFILAFILLWLSAIIGVQSLAPIISEVKTESIAQKAGLSAQHEIIALNGEAINSWRDFQLAMMPYIGSVDSLKLTVKSLDNNNKQQITLPLLNWHLDSDKPDLLASMGIIPFFPTIPADVSEVVKDLPADKAGIVVGDRILAVDNKPITDWLDLVDYVKQRPNTLIHILIQRQNTQQKIALTIGEKMQNGKAEGFIGLKAVSGKWPPHWLRTQKETWLGGLQVAGKQTVQLTTSTFTLLGRMLTGKLALNSISGPIGIAKGAGDSARSGIVHYLFFMALMSISLGVLNLLPIPLLDGGHLMYYAFEIILRKPLPDKLKTMGVYIGMLFLGALMIIAFSNDISRLIPH